LSDDELAALGRVLEVIRKGGSDEELAEELRQQLHRNRERMFLFLQLAGLTRSKILQDLKGATAAHRVSVPSSPLLLHERCVWALAGPYLAARLGGILKHLAELGEGAASCLEALNQATWPGYIRQERAKRQGHEAEGRLAIVLRTVGIPFHPYAKADNPLCPDAQIHGVSFDIVIPDLEAPRVCVKAMVHTANIGQFGESKDALEIREASEMIKQRFPEGRRPILMSLMDGVGFRSNPSGLNEVLTTADEFCQFRTLWKGVVVAAAQTGRRVSLALPPESARAHERFLRRYADAIIGIRTEDLDSLENDPHVTRAGEGFILPPD